MTREKKALLITLIIFCLFIIIWIICHLVYKDREEQIKSDYSFTIGELIYFGSPSSELPRTITYEYCANETRYTETIIVGTKFDIYEDFEKCRGRKYWVIYQNSNPKQCMIDLSREIQDEIYPVPPSDLSNFEYSDYRTIITISFKKKDKSCIDSYQ